MVTAKETSFIKSILVLLKFRAVILTGSIVQLWASFPRVGLKGSESKFKKRKKNVSSSVEMLYDTSQGNVSRRSFAWKMYLLPLPFSVVASNSLFNASAHVKLVIFFLQLRPYSNGSRMLWQLHLTLFDALSEWCWPHFIQQSSIHYTTLLRDAECCWITVGMSNIIHPLIKKLNRFPNSNSI